jgi:hypothetical protein
MIVELSALKTDYYIYSEGMQAGVLATDLRRDLMNPPEPSGSIKDVIR